MIIKISKYDLAWSCYLCMDFKKRYFNYFLKIYISNNLQTSHRLVYNPRCVSATQTGKGEASVAN